MSIPGKQGTREGESVIPGFHADPSLTVVGNRYVLATTTDGHVDWAADSFRLFSSPDLLSWDDHGVILQLGVDVAWARERAWAPMYLEHRGRFLLYFSADDNIGVAVSDNPAGPFVDLGRPLVARGAFSGRAIDPSVFVDFDGQAYLLWGNTDAHMVPLAEDLVSFEPAEVHTWHPTGFREAPWLHRRGDQYYLSWSENDTREADYRVRYAVSSSPAGPWHDRGVLLQGDPERGIAATGHHSILQRPGLDDWIIAYHRFAIPDGDGFHREIAFDRLLHLDDGSIRPVRPSSSPITIPLVAETGPTSEEH
jgi:beta-xylosidase